MEKHRKINENMKNTKEKMRKKGDTHGNKQKTNEKFEEQ